MGSKIRIATNWRKSQGVCASLRETTQDRTPKSEGGAEQKNDKICFPTFP